MMLPAYLPTYAYYAPLGALTVMYSALYDSAVEGLRALAAVTVGVSLSVALHFAAGPNAITVAIALGVGTVLGNARNFGAQGSWVPIAALFVFTAGGPDTLEYVVGYLSQMLLGAVVGMVINLVVFPPLALHEVERATRAVRRDIVRVLGALVDLIDADEDSIEDRAAGVRAALESLPDTRQRLRQATSQAERAQQGNPRRTRWQDSHSDVLALAGSSESAASVVEDMAREMLEDRTALHRSDSSRLSAATGALRDVIVQSREGVPPADLVRRTNDLLDEAVPDGAPFVVPRARRALRRCLRIATGWTE
ncbi:MAG TPA: hypothetical protein VG502_05680 [Flexivirga sp.]|nr:hypothetical protein [Flexivirga sp.]